MSARLEARSLTCTRGGRVVFHDVALSLNAGEALSLRGPNGSGKSSLLRMLAGLLAPSAGTIRWNGHDIAEDRESHRGRVGYLGMLDALKPTLSVSENVAFHAALHGGVPARAEQAVAAVGLAAQAGTPARRLSQGQRRRAAIARLLVQDSPLWLLDEPTLALDQDGLARLGQAMQAHLAGGGIAIIATHVELPAVTAATLTLGAGAAP
ncbi:MAG: heme ABC exporter ATP-binding protein CcmA [Alphaproteobacteria bacterium]|nr:heme ABC exporter ATP-binding protein CcmA [Alphaproteobacteria bacterium]